MLISDDTIQEKAWTDESELVLWDCDHVAGRKIKGGCLINALCRSEDASMLVFFAW